MDSVIALLLGVLQGIIEWLPISSTGQLIVVMMNLANIEWSTAFALAFYLHLGTMLAVVVKFNSHIKNMILTLPKFKENELSTFLIISTIFTAATGLPLYLLLKDYFGRQHGDVITGFIGLFLILTGIIIYLSKKKVGKAGSKKIKGSNKWDMIIAGAAQGVAVLPGFSRSGMTIASLIARGFNQEDALLISFLMSIPAVIGIVILEVCFVGIEAIGLSSIIIGILAAFLVGYLTIETLMRFAKKVRFDVFCIVFGTIAVLIFFVL